MTEIKKQLKTYIEPLEQALEMYMQDIGAPENLGEAGRKLPRAMWYSLLSGGKRIRAVLLLATYEMLAKDFKAAIPFAAAIEMIHAYSLIHDDLPCMDDDDMRRGKPSCHIKFGEATALLAGDGLLTLAFETISSKRCMDIFGAEKTLVSVKALSNAAGVRGMVGGQILDLENEDRDITLEELTVINSKKTGALIKSACEMGCILGGADEKTTSRVLSYAEKIGLSFQIIDDVLDITADEKQLGKPVGSDGENHKTTFASVCGIKKAKELAAKLTDEAINEIKGTGLDAGFLCGLAEYLAGRTH